MINFFEKLKNRNEVDVFLKTTDISTLCKYKLSVSIVLKQHGKCSGLNCDDCFGKLPFKDGSVCNTIIPHNESLSTIAIFRFLVAKIIMEVIGDE